MDSDLPDSILWFIFSKLSFKDQFKTCILSKHWLHEWRLSSTHLSFDLYNTFHFDTLPKELPLFQSLQSQFTERLDQFMLHYQHATISSIRVNFPLGNKHSDDIDRLISQGIAKGVKHIQLLFSHDTDHTDLKIEPYRFSFNLLSDTDSLTYLHLENCFLVSPTDFSGLKNLRTLVLQLIGVKKDLLEGLFSNCMHLVDLTLDNCILYSIKRIFSPRLLHLKIVSRYKHMKRIEIIAPNLSSLEYSCYDRHSIYLEAHRLSQFIYSSTKMIGFANTSSLKSITTVVMDGFHQFLERWVTQFLFKECLQLEDVTFKNCSMPYDMEIKSTKLLHLKIIDCGFESYNKIIIVARNLSSFEYSGHAGKFSIKAPKLSKVFWNAVIRVRNQNFLGPIPELHQIENLAIITSHLQISNLKVLGRFQNLRQLEIFMDVADYPYADFFSVLDVLIACQHLQKLSLTVRNSSSFGFLNPRKSGKFFHNELKHVELHGCVSTPVAIEFAMNLLRNVSSLTKILFSSPDKFYVGAETWTKGWNSYWKFDRNYIYEKLKDEVKGQCELIIL